MAAQAFGSDYTTQVDTRAVGVMLRRDPRDPWTLSVAYESDAPVRLAATPISGVFEPVLPTWRIAGVRAELRGSGGWVPDGDRATRGLWNVWSSVGALTGSDGSAMHVAPLVARISATLRIERRTSGDRTLMTQSEMALAGGRALPPQWLAFAGGPWSAPGYNFSHFETRAYVSQRVEVRQPIPAPGIKLGRFGKSPAHITLAPFVQAIAIGSGLRHVPSPVAGVYPSVGLGTLFFFDLLRVDVARGLRNGQWRFAIDIDRAFWGML